MATHAFWTAAALAAAVLSAPAHATLIASGVNLTFGGANPNAIGQNDNSGKTSGRLSATDFNNSGQLRMESGYFIETFDARTAMVQGHGNGGQGTTLSGALTSNVAGNNIAIRNAGCAFNSYGALGGSANVGVIGGGFAAVQGSIPGQAATPAGDTSCYGVSPQPGNGSTGAMTISYSNLLSAGDYINYFGLYYGSIDAYNDLYFYADDAATDLVATVKGSTILAALGGTAGDQLDDKSNVYVNLDFDPTVGFRSFRFVTTNIAVEVDNIVVGRASRDVPEPASLALLATGLAALGLARRRKAVKA